LQLFAPFSSARNCGVCRWPDGDGGTVGWHGLTRVTISGYDRGRAKDEVELRRDAPDAANHREAPGAVNWRDAPDAANHREVPGAVNCRETASRFA